MAWELNRGSDIECLLPGSTECQQRTIEIGHADRRRCSRQRAEGILAGPATQIRQKAAKPTNRWRKAMTFLLPYDKKQIPVEIAEQNLVGSLVSRVESYRPDLSQPESVEA